MRPAPICTPEPAPNAMTRQLRAAFRVLAFMFAFGPLVVAATPALAQSAEPRLRLERADPPLETAVSPAPETIALWFEQAVYPGAGSATIEVIGETGERQAIGPATVYEVDPRHMSAPVLGTLEPGTYSVVWTVRLAEDANERSGAYGFRVGLASIPGAATEGDAWPAFWAVMARFLTLFGLALGLGGLVLTVPTVWRGLGSEDGQRRCALILGGGVIALIGTVVEPSIAAVLTVPSPTIGSLLRNYPPAWWLRAGAIAGLVLISSGAVLARAAPRAVVRLLWLGSVVLAALALTAVSVTNVSAWLEPPTPTADVLMVLAQVVLVILIGIGFHATITPTPDTGHTPPFQRLGWLVTVLTVAALLLIAALGVLLLSGPADLVSRPFGWLILALAVLLVLMLAVAAITWRSRQGGPSWVAAGLATLAVVGVATLALAVPPGKAAEGASLAVVDLVAPVSVEVDGQPGLVHLLYQPAAIGENTMAVWLANAEGEVPGPAERPAFDIELTSLHDLTPPIQLDPASDDVGTLAIATGELPSQGWWQANVTVTPPTGEPATATFFIVLPDPNVHGFGPEAGSSPAAEAVFERGLATMTALHQVRFNVAIGGGGGTFARSAIAINDGDDGSTRSYQEEAATYETIIIGDRQWLRQGSEEWTERPAGYIFTPTEWGATYEPATGFALGPMVELGGEPSQVVTFWLPRQENPRQEPAWYAWWVGTETGQIHRETMISTRHYMVYNFSGFNQPIEVIAPTSG